MIKKSRFSQPTVNNSVIHIASPISQVIELGAVDTSGVLQNLDGELVQLNYGMIITNSIVPLNSQISTHSTENALAVGMLGNNLRLTFDPYWDTSQFPAWKQIDVGRSKTNELVSSIGTYMSPESLFAYTQKLGVNDVIFKYSEPIVNFDYILDFVEFVDGRLKTYLNTNGYVNHEIVTKYYEKFEALVIQLHSTDSFFYKKHAKGDLKYIKSAIEHAMKVNPNVQISTTLVPGENDNAISLNQIASYISQLQGEMKWIFQIFRPTHKVQDKTITSETSVSHALEIARKYGIEAVVIDC